MEAEHPTEMEKSEFSRVNGRCSALLKCEKANSVGGKGDGVPYWKRKSAAW